MMLSLLLAIAVACTGPADKAPPAEVPCAPGYLDDGGTCVPETCGTGTWGDLPVDEATVYVDTNATEGGDGSAQAPLRAIQPALDLAGDHGGGLVAVAAGSYPETLTLSSDHAEVHLAGRCRELVTLDASVGDENTSGIDFSSAATAVEVSGITVQGSSFVGVFITSGVVTLRDSAVVGSAYLGLAATQGGWNSTDLLVERCELTGNSGAGLLAFDSGVQVVLREVEIRDTLEASSTGLGVGIGAWGGVEMTVEDSLVADNAETGVLVAEQGTVVTLLRTEISGTLGAELEDNGDGVFVLEGASLVVESCELLGNRSTGLAATGAGTEVVIRGSSIQDTRPDRSGNGFGLQAMDGVSLLLEDTEILRSTDMGVAIGGMDTEVVLVDCLVGDTRLNPEGGGGMGIVVEDGAHLRAERCEVANNWTLGLLAQEAGTLVALADSTIRDTLPSDGTTGGYGIEVLDGASLTAEGCLLEGNTAAGLLISGADASAGLQDTTITHTRPSPTDTWGAAIAAHSSASVEATGLLVIDNEAYGVAVNTDASLSCDGCTFSGNQHMGAFADGGGDLALSNSTVRDTTPGDNPDMGIGIGVSDGASLTLEGCLIEDNTSGGIVEIGSETRAVLIDTVVANTRLDPEGEQGSGLAVASGATLRAEGCDIVANRSSGIFAMDAGTVVTLEDSTIRGTTPRGDSEMGFGVVVMGGASLGAESCLIEDNSATGLVASGADAAVDLQDTTISLTRTSPVYTSGVGITAELSATIRATDLQLIENEGPGAVAHLGGSLTCTECTFRGNQFAGAVAMSGGALTLEGALIEQTGAGVNLGGGYGVFAVPGPDSPPPSTTILSSTILDNPIAGVQLRGGGSHTITDSEIHGGEGEAHGAGRRCGHAVYAGEGVEAWNEGLGLQLTRSALVDGQGAGLFLDGAQATLDEAVFEDNALDIVVQGADCEQPPAGQACSPEGVVECCPTWDYPTCTDDYSLYLEIEGLADSRSAEPYFHEGATQPTVPKLPPLQALELVNARARR